MCAALVASAIAPAALPQTASAQPRHAPATIECAPPAPSPPPDPLAFPIKNEDAPLPWVYAASAVAIDAETGRVMFARHAHERRAPASTTKMMTAIVALESGIDESMPVIAQTDSTQMAGSSVMGLWPGAPLTVRDLLYGLMVPSGNDAALELARVVAGSEAAFVDRMNAKAQELGMNDTHFANPHGLDDWTHYSSAEDLAILARYAMQNARFRELAATRDYWLPDPFDYNLHNGNSLLENYPGADGVKIGWTEWAGWTFVASAQRDGHDVIVALMNTPDRDADATALLNWAFDSYSWHATTRRAVSIVRVLDALGIGQTVEKWFALCPAQPGIGAGR